MHVRHVLLLAAAAALAPAAGAAAQTSDTTFFHPGQWGADFTVGSGFTGVGAIHFRSPTRATVYDLTGSYDHSSGGGDRISAVNGAVSIGSRAYHAVSRRVVGWTTLGLSFQYSRQHAMFGAIDQTTKGVGAGVFLDFGASWMVTPHLGLGAEWRLGASYVHGSVSGTTGGGTSDVVSVDLTGIGLVGQLYF